MVTVFDSAHHVEAMSYQPNVWVHQAACFTCIDHYCIKSEPNAFNSRPLTRDSPSINKVFYNALLIHGYVVSVLCSTNTEIILASFAVAGPDKRLVCKSSTDSDIVNMEE